MADLKLYGQQLTPALQKAEIEYRRKLEKSWVYKDFTHLLKDRTKGLTYYKAGKMKKRLVLVDLRRWGKYFLEILEDLEDCYAIKKSKIEKAIAWDEVKKRLDARPKKDKPKQVIFSETSERVNKISRICAKQMKMAPLIFPHAFEWSKQDAYLIAEWVYIRPRNTLEQAEKDHISHIYMLEKFIVQKNKKK